MYRVVGKQQAKREQTHPVCLHAVEKYEIIKKQQVKNEQIKRKQTCSACFVKVLNSQKTSSRLLKIILRK